MWSSLYAKGEGSDRDSFLSPQNHDLYHRNGGLELHARNGAAERYFNPTGSKIRALREPADVAMLSRWTTEARRYGR